MNAIYHRLSKIPIIRSDFNIKIFLISFLGIHISLLGVFAYTLNNEQNTPYGRVVIITVLVFILFSTALILYALNKLKRPLTIDDKDLNSSIRNRANSNLPIEYQHEAEKLMFLLQNTVTHLNELSIEKQEITTLVSHNLRTPLNQILGFCQLIKLDEKNVLEYIEKIEMVTHLQLSNLGDLLTQLMAKDSQMNTSKMMPYNVNNFIKHEVAVINDLLLTKNLELVLHLSNEALNVNKNKNKVSLAFQNLLSNAVKFSHKGGKIHVYTRKREDIVEIEVLDEGMGFPKDYQSGLFKDARNTGRKGTNNEPSMGLGLHLSNKIIENLGGKLSAFSEGDGKGASFKIIL